MSRSEPNPDVIIVGSGFAGLAIAAQLTRANVAVTVLEQGPVIHEIDHPTVRDDWEWASLREWNFSPNVRGLDQDYPVTGGGFRPYMYNAVGGSTNHFGGFWHRLKPVDFRKGTEHGLEGTIDWPISYEDLAGFYDLNDRFVGISGHPGDPAYPPRPDAHRLPPLRHGCYYELVSRGLDRLGWHWWPGDNAIISEPYDGRMGCNLNGFCPMGCPRGSLGTAWQAYGRRAMLNGVDLRPNTRVLRVTVDGSGAADGVEYVDRSTGTEHRINAPVVVVACNGIGSPRLLLNSTKNSGAESLGNSHDQVGRHLLLHGYICGDLWFDEPTEHYKGPFGAGLYSQEFHDTDPSRGCVNGITFTFGTGYGPAAAAFGGTAGTDPAPWGPDHHREFERRFDHNVFVAIQIEDIPRTDNRVTLDPEVNDSSGVPAAHATYRGSDNDITLLRFGMERMKEIAEACGARALDLESVDEYNPHGWHLMGTCRMGTDPETSVVDQWHRVWDTPGLVVCDGSSMTTSGAGNPTATVGALGLRCAHGLLRDRNRKIQAEAPVGAAS